MPVPARFASCLLRRLKARDQARHHMNDLAQALVLIPHGEQSLFEFELERQPRTDLKRQPAVRGTKMRRHLLRLMQATKGLAEELNGAPGFRCSGPVGARIVVKKAHPAAQIRAIPIGKQDFKTPLADGQNVLAAILQFTHDLQSARRASNVLESLIAGKNNSEFLPFGILGLGSQAFPDHFLVAFLEDMEGQQFFRQKNNLKWEKGQKDVHERPRRRDYSTGR